MSNRDAAFEKMRQRYADAGMDFCFPPDLRQPAWSIAEWVFDVSWQAATEACAKLFDEIADRHAQNARLVHSLAERIAEQNAQDIARNAAAMIRGQGKEQKDG